MPSPRRQRPRPPTTSAPAPPRAAVCGWPSSATSVPSPPRPASGSGSRPVPASSTCPTAISTGQPSTSCARRDPTSSSSSAAPTVATQKSCCTTRIASPRSGPRVPYVVAGNVDARAEVVDVLERGRRVALPTANVLPRIGVLDPMPARVAIREVFVRHVIGGKGLSKGPAFGRLVRAATPDAVLAGVELLAESAGRRGGRRRRRGHDRRLLGPDARPRGGVAAPRGRRGAVARAHGRG